MGRLSNHRDLYFGEGALVTRLSIPAVRGKLSFLAAVYAAAAASLMPRENDQVRRF